MKLYIKINDIVLFSSFLIMVFKYISSEMNSGCNIAIRYWHDCDWRHTPTTVYTDVTGLLFVFIDMQHLLVLLLLLWKLLGMVEMFKQLPSCHWTVQTYIM